MSVPCLSLDSQKSHIRKRAAASVTRAANEITNELTDKPALYRKGTIPVKNWRTQFANRRVWAKNTRTELKSLRNDWD